MKIIFFGTPDFAVPTLQRLIDRPEFEVIAVVTQPDKPRSRGKKLIPSPVKVVAETANIPVWQPRRVKKHQETRDRLRNCAADAFVVVAYGQILSREILEMPRLGCVNGHGSILPKYRGAAPIQWSLVNGEPETGMTTMLMDEGMDTGPMLLKSTLKIDLLENFGQLASRMAISGADAIAETLLKLNAGELEPKSQDDSEATYAPPISKEDYRLDWTKSAIDLHNQIRGFYPNCTARFRDGDIKIVSTAPLGEAYWPQLPQPIATLQNHWQQISDRASKPGEVVYIAKKLGPVVATGDGFLLLGEVQLPGKKIQLGRDFVNGTRVEVGEYLS